MKLALVRVGNSRGIRIPKPIIDQLGFENSVDVRIERDRLIIAAENRPRQGWAQAFKSAGASGNDKLLLDSAADNDFDREDWQW